MRSVAKLQDMMAETKKLIPYINRGDREPGQDGHVFVLAENSSHIMGRFVVQVKYSNIEEKGTVSTYLEEEHLRYYESEDAPFIYIIVDPDTEVAYWKYTEPRWVDRQEISKGKSVPFDRENKISYNNHGYVGDLRNLLQSHRSIYKEERISSTEKALKELTEIGHHKRAIHKLRLELDDAARSVCRSHNLPFSHYDKLRGVMKINGILAADDDGNRGGAHTMSQESFYSKLYRGIVDIDEGIDDKGENPDIEPVIDDGLELLEHLYTQQMNPDFRSDSS